jgi:hypothetical protein
MSSQYLVVAAAAVSSTIILIFNHFYIFLQKSLSNYLKLGGLRIDSIDELLLVNFKYYLLLSS